MIRASTRTNPLRQLSALGRDVRHAVRTLRREPALVAGVALTFALAVGTTGAMFGLVHRLMLAPPPGVRDAERVVRLALAFSDEGGGGGGSGMTTTSYPVFRTIGSLGGVVQHAAAVRTDSTTAGRGADLTRVSVVQASGGFFATLGATPSLGRVFGPADDELPVGNDVVVLGHAYWRQRFAGDSSVIGRTMVVDDQPLTIIGVASKGFNGIGLAPVDVYVPLTTALRSRGTAWVHDPGMLLVSVVGRLRDGVSAATAGGMATAALRAEAGAGAGAGGTLDAKAPAAVFESIVPGRSRRTSPQARVALWLGGVSVVVLLIAAANVGTLLLLRAARRRRDAAVRMALGARRGALARQALVESLLLATAGGAAGVVVAAWLADAVRLTLLPDLAATERVVDTAVLAISLAASVGAGVLAGLAPMAPLLRRGVASELRAGGGHGASGRFGVQYTLVAVQAALCTVLLVGASLFVRSLARVQAQDLGFSTARLLHVTLEFRDPTPAVERDAVHVEAVRRVAALHGVTGATVVQGMPFSSHNIPPIHVPGYELPPPHEQQLPILYGATPAYLDLMGVTLREGRLFTERDAAGAPLVALVNDTMARTVWPGTSAVGKCIQAGFGDAPPGPGDDPMAIAATLPCREVVGVVRDSRARSLRLQGGEGALMQYYLPFAQLPPAPFPDVPFVHGLLVRTAGDPARLAAAVQRTIQGTSAAPVYALVRPYQELLDPQLRDWRLGATLFSAFGALALAIAAVGLFAVVSYLVAQRTPEIGVRLALGGSGARVARLVVWDAVRLAGAGAAAGTVVALVAAPLVQSMLFETSARDARSLGEATMVLLVVALLSSALPAWRASRVSPMTVLKEQG